MIVRQSTARTILVGPVLDSTGAAKTDEVVGSIKVTKNGVVGAANGSATLTHDHAGKYLLALTATDTDTVGVLEISLSSGTNDMPVRACNVVETAIWDALFADGATGLLPANVTQINSNAASADRLALSAAVIIPGTVDTTNHTPTTTEFEADDITEATTQHYNGRVIIFTSGALLGQATSISNYSLVSGRGHVTVVALTEPPANNDTFIIV